MLILIETYNIQKKIDIDNHAMHAIHNVGANMICYITRMC